MLYYGYIGVALGGLGLVAYLDTKNADVLKSGADIFANGLVFITMAKAVYIDNLNEIKSLEAKVNSS